METLQPKLRFPEFDGNWELKQLKQITSLITKGTTPQNFSENGINFIKIECLNGHNIDTSKCLFIDEKTHTKELKRSILKENDLLFAIAGATIGKCTIVTKEALPANTNQALAIIRLKENENKDYIFQILTSEGMSKYIKDNISVGAQPNLNLEQINSFSFSYPTIEEQSKIANFLSSVDEKLNLLKEKKALLEDYKKGIMQKIFNQELRFKDDNGEDFEEWEFKKIKEIFKFRQGIQCGVENQYLENQEGLLRFIRIIDLTNLVEPKRYILDPGSIYHIGKDDLFMVRYGSAGLLGYGFEGVIANNLFQIIPLFPKCIINKFYKYVFDSKIELLERLASSTTMPALNFKSLETLELPFLSIGEQTKIANFLSAIDEKIELVSNQIQGTQEYKKGLLQQMFV